MNNPSISVVMTTFNGAAHLRGQLTSLRDQSLRPDEVLIFDDQSEDETPALLEAFLRDNDLPGWRVIRRPSRKGWKRNFMDGAARAEGELIFLCDQDDIWDPDKIQRMAEEMGRHPEALLLACDYRLVYEEGAVRSKVYRKRPGEKRNPVSPYPFRRNFFQNPRPGCSYALRRSFFREAAPYWFPAAPHDEFLWLMAALQGGAYFYNRELMTYVRYAGNASDIRYKDIQAQLKNLDYISEMLRRLVRFAGEHPARVTERKKRYLAQAQVWCEKRKKLMKTRNPLRWLALMPWWGYYNSPKNALSDLVLVLFGSFRRKARR
ncbi:MAG: glycosyltransferase [Clostridia bacterium]|nr:glycosyltransferase [Clostridia bacterium]